MASANSLNIGENGYVVFDDVNNEFYGRTFVAGTGISFGTSDPSGVAGDTIISSTASLTDLHVARFIVASSTVGTGANYTSIAAAIAAASSGSTIFVQPGVYTENLTLKAGVTITAFGGERYGNVEIRGKLTFTSTGSTNISNIRLMTNGDNFLVVSGGNHCIVRIFNCNIVVTGNVVGLSYTNSNELTNIAFD
jgi:pectin methylesterase-like acyl-CoA thioesterase